MGPLRQDKQKSGRSSGWAMKSLTFSTLSSVKTALRTSLAVKLFPKNKSNLGTINNIRVTFGTQLFTVLTAKNLLGFSKQVCYLETQICGRNCLPKLKTEPCNPTFTRLKAHCVQSLYTINF